MYHTVKLDTSDQHAHRFLWRDLKDDAPAEDYVMQVSFEDKPAATVAHLAWS